MSVTPAPTHSVVPYESPNARALQATGTTATGFLIALGLLVLPIVGDFLRAGAFDRTALIALATAVGMAVVSVGTTYLVKLSQARGSDVPPTVAADGTTPLTSTVLHGENVALPALPLIDSGLLVQLVERTLRDSLASAAPEPPQQAVSVGHRVVPETVAVEAPVKRSHHAAKQPAVVAPVDVVADH